MSKGNKGFPAKNDVQDFMNAADTTCGIYPSHADMPMHNPVGIKMAYNNTFHGMPAYPNQYVWEGHTDEPFRPGDMRTREELP